MNGRTTPTGPDQHAERGAGQDAERAYEADARRWLRAYPPRWRRRREDEVLGVLLDLRPPGARGLSLRARLDLLRGALGFRWRTRLPFLTWLLWRFGDVTPGPAHRDWLLDNTSGRFSGFRAQWVGFGGVFVVVMVVVLSDFGRDPQPWAFLPLAAGLAVSLMPRRWWARRLQTDLKTSEVEDDLAQHFDRAVPWLPRTRWAWGAGSCSRWRAWAWGCWRPRSGWRPRASLDRSPSRRCGPRAGKTTVYPSPS